MTDQQKLDTEAVEAAAKAMDDVDKAAADTITLSTGLRLRLHRVSPFLVQKAATALAKPKPPRIHIEDQNRWEDNPADPVYLDELAVWEAKTVEAGVNVMLGMGTSVDYLPDGMEGPDGDGWLADAEFFGLTVDRNSRHSRYLTWLLCFALVDPKDLADAIQAAQRMTGIKEEEAAAALDSFRDRALQRTADGVSTQAS